MKAGDFDEGDNFNTPFISGYEKLFDEISDDMINNPNDYKRWEMAFILEMPPKAYPGYWSDVCEYIDHWCDERSVYVHGFQDECA